MEAESAERRHLTVLFCDLVDSTVLADQLDPEDLRRLVLQYQVAAGAVVARYDGHVAQYLGDGLLVYFGYPVAHEDDPQRALYSGLEILDAIGDLNEALQKRWGVRLAVRIGIHSGPVVTGMMGTQQHGERLAMGQTPNVAARLQSLAGPDEIILSAQTAGLVQDKFALDDLGPQNLKGVSAAIGAYRLLGGVSPEKRFRLASTQTGTPFVGREREQAAMHEMLDRVERGRGGVIILSAEAGMGKSRLIQHVHDQLGDRVRWSVLACSPYHLNSALFPIGSHLNELMGIELTDAATVRLAKVETFLDARGFDRLQVIPLLAPILGLKPGPDYPRPPLSVKQVKDQTFDALKRLLFAATSDGPLIILVEDLHWIDPSSLEFLGYLVLLAPTRPVLLVLTCRPEFQPPWGDSSSIVRLRLEPLAAQDVRALVDGLIGGQSLPDWVRREIESRTDGVPIFVEELTKNMLSTPRAELLAPDQSGGAGTAIPATLQDSLMARLDGLGEAKETLQRASVIGRTFSYGLLSSIWPDDEGALARNLHRLLREQLLESIADRDQIRFRFRHALLQDAAYESMLRTRRAELHGEVANTIQARFGELMEQRPELMADHLTRAGRPEEALPYWLSAGRNAFARSALQEAINLFNRSLELIASLPSTPALQAIAQRIHAGLGNAIANATHWGNPEAQVAFERAAALAEALGDQDGRYRCMISLRMIYTSQGRHLDAEINARNALQMATEHGSGKEVVRSRAARIQPAWHLGRFDEAVAHAEAGLAALDELSEDRFVLEQRLYLYAYMSQALWVSGRPGRCLEVMRLGEALLEQVSDPYAQSFFCVWGATALTYLKDHAWLERLLARGRSIGELHGFGAILGWARIQQGWLTAQTGDSVRGLEMIQSAMASYFRQGAGADEPLCQIWLADAQVRSGNWEDAIRTIDRALTKVDRSGEVCHHAEAVRVRGQALKALGRLTEAEGAFASALQLARDTGALGWELRAASELAALRAEFGDHAAARTIVGAVLERFGDGQETPDLRDAQGLLNGLSAVRT